MNYLSLFSGAGGGDLAFQHLLGFKCVGYVEYENYCQRVIKQRIEDGLLDAAPIFGDIRAFNCEGYAESYQGMVDIVSGGFPCQDISCAGKGAGIEGKRSGLWTEMADTIRTVRPKYAFVENSPMLTIRGLGRVLGDLAEMGFDARWGVLGADLFGYNHRRARIWILADSECSMRQNNKGIFGKICLEKLCKRPSSIAFSHIPYKLREPSDGNFTYRKDDGLATAMDRIKAIGNGQVPICAATAFKILSGVVR